MCDYQVHILMFQIFLFEIVTESVWYTMLLILFLAYKGTCSFKG